MGAPVEPPQDYNIIEWIVGAIWVVGATIAGVISKIWIGLRRKIVSLEGTIVTLEKNAAAIDHDLRGIRQNQVMLEKTQDIRHKDNQQESAELREFVGEELRELRRRIDRLLERTGGGMER